jgi:hypothetical protein
MNSGDEKCAQHFERKYFVDLDVDTTTKMDLKETRCENTDWIQMAQNRAQALALVKTVMKL